MIRNTSPNEVLKATSAEQISYPYHCLTCDAEYWWNLGDIMRLTNQPVMPCNHSWQSLSYDWRRDPSQARAHAEQVPHPVS